MNDATPENENRWTEEVTRQFIDFGNYFIPGRELQTQLLAGLLGDLPPNARILELCCGEGRLAEMLLEAHPGYRLLALDGSQEMLARAVERLRRFGERAACAPFDLASPAWRAPEAPFEAVVSSLAIHHLDGPQKRQLYQDVYRMLAPGGVFAVADPIAFQTETGARLAADAWDEAVHARSLELDGSLDAYDFFIREGWNTFRYFYPDDIDKPSPLYDQLKWLEEAGFAGIEVHWLLAGHAVFSAKKA